MPEGERLSARVCAERAGGALVAVVGPSGSGKDTLIDYARKRLAGADGVFFVRRVVTRPAMPGAEDHDTLSHDAFAAAQESGAFAVNWEAHGLQYRIPRSAVRRVAGGEIGVVNGSRVALAAIRRSFGHVMTVHIVCRPEVLAERLAVRGREDADQQRQRLQRAKMPSAMDIPAVVIDNSGDVAQAGDVLVAAIRGFIGRENGRL